MAGRDRVVAQTGFRIPPELLVVVKCYQNARRMPSLNQTVIELLETHPEIRKIVAEMLDGAVTVPLG